MDQTQKKGNQFTLALDTKTNQAGATGLKIYYKKPNSGNAGSVSATANGTVLTGTITAAINNEAGRWAFEAASTLSGESSETRGETFFVDVLDLFAEK